MSDYWLERRVLVTGASGFIGLHLVNALLARGARVTAALSPSQAAADQNQLRTLYEPAAWLVADLTRREDCLAICHGQEVVLNVAHLDGSIAFKSARPASIFRQNMLITLNMLEAARQCAVDRVLITSSTEVYAPDTSVPTPEHEGFVGLPQRITDGYAWSKRMSEFAGELYAREYGMKVALARPASVYGPGDHLDPRKGRVIPMFLQKVFQGDEEIVIWGNGEQTRTFLYVEDLTRGLLDLVERYPCCDPVNFSGDEEITIKELAELIVRLAGRQVRIVCDLDKPSGAASRSFDTSKAHEILDFRPQISLELGLQRTIERDRWRYSKVKAVAE